MKDTGEPRLIIKPGTEWSTVYGRCREVAPEAFGDEELLNFWGGRWRWEGTPAPVISPVDGTVLPGPLLLELRDAARAVRAGLNEHRTWSVAAPAERKARVSAAIDDLGEHRELLALLLVWGTGKTWRSATAEVDRCVDGVRWCLARIDGLLAGREPLAGPVSNIAGWNHPLSVLMHAMLVQALAGNAAVARAPAEGGVHCLTLATALAARHGVPLTLVSGSESELAGALIHSSMIGCLSVLGAEVAGSVTGSGKRHIIQQKAPNRWGVWEFSDWPVLAGHIRASFDNRDQCGTAYPGYVVQRSLSDEFLAAYLPAVRSVTFGHPLAVEAPEDPLPELDFGPLISELKVKELRNTIDEALAGGGVPVYRGTLSDGRFLSGQDTSAYLEPTAILGPPPSSPLYHAEPFGPVDTVVLVDTEAELLAAMNAGDGSLAASFACDDETTAQRLAAKVPAFAVGIDRTRSRDDRGERFGAFVGGEPLVQAVTVGPPGERLHGHFPAP